MNSLFSPAVVLDSRASRNFRKSVYSPPRSSAESPCAFAASIASISVGSAGCVSSVVAEVSDVVVTDVSSADSFELLTDEPAVVSTDALAEVSSVLFFSLLLHPDRSEPEIQIASSKAVSRFISNNLSFRRIYMLLHTLYLFFAITK